MQDAIIVARKLEHQYPHALKVKYKGSSPKTMFQLSGFYYRVEGLGAS